MNKEPKAKHMGTNQQAISIDDAILTVGEFGAGQRVQVCVVSREDPNKGVKLHTS